MALTLNNVYAIIVVDNTYVMLLSRQSCFIENLVKLSVIQTAESIFMHNQTRYCY